MSFRRRGIVIVVALSAACGLVLAGSLGWLGRNPTPTSMPAGSVTAQGKPVRAAPGDLTAETREILQHAGFIIIADPVPLRNIVNELSESPEALYAPPRNPQGLMALCSGMRQEAQRGWPRSGWHDDSVVLKPYQNRVAYVEITPEGKSRLLIRGQQVGLHDRISRVFVSQDEKRYAYVAHDDGFAQRLYLDGKHVDDYFQVGELAFSQDGQTAVWAAAKQQPDSGPDGYDIYVDGKRFVAGFRWVGADPTTACPIAISPDHRRWAVRGQVFGPRNGGIGGYAVMVDGKMQPTFGEVVDGSLRFTADSTEVLYAAGTPRKGGYRLYRNGVPGKAWNYILGGIQLSADGRHVAYTAYTGEQSRFVVAELDSGNPDWSPGLPGLVIDDVLRVPNTDLWRVSPDLTRVLAVKMEMDNPFNGVIRTHLQVDDHKILDLPVDGPSLQALFSRDGRHYCCWSAAKDQPLVIVDGRVLPMPAGLEFWAFGFGEAGQITALAADGRFLWQLKADPDTLLHSGRTGRDARQ